MNYKAVIIDDEHNCVEILAILLKRDYPDLDVINTFTNPQEALDFLQSNKVDLVFLDIQMPFITGIELLTHIKEPDFHVIFTTAYDQYAIEAIKLSALDYILKPIDDELLEQAVEKFRKIKRNNMKDQLQQFLIQMQKSKSGGSFEEDRISIAFQDKISFYKADEIGYCQSHDNYTTIFLTNGEKVTASKTIKHFEEKLIPLGFIRTHQSYLINKSLIKEFSKKDGGYIIMQNGTNIPVSRQRKEEVLQLFKKV